jgi:3-oxoacyl-[acyl-carrier protein] reductase
MSVAECPDEPYRSMIDQHLWTTLNVVRELTPRMARAGRGRVVAVSSPMAAAPTAGMSAYGVGKAAMETLLAGLAGEVRDQGVTVNVLRVRTIDASDDATPGPAAQVTTASEISAAIRYLFSDAAAAITGQRIGMDRGRS